MSSEQPPPPPAGPPPAGPPPAGPPPAGPPSYDGPPAPGSRSRLPLLLAGGVVLLLAVVVVLVVTLTGSKAAEDARSVEDVADIAVAAAEDLDVDAGIDLFCEVPPAEARESLEDLIDEAQQDAGTEDPDASYEISGIQGDEAGSFRVDVTSDEEALRDRSLAFLVRVSVEDGRSCISGISQAPS